MYEDYDRRQWALFKRKLKEDFVTTLQLLCVVGFMVFTTWLIYRF